MKNILYVSHDGSNKSGAALALIELLDNIDRKKFNPIVLLPNKNNGLISELNDRNIDYIVKKYYLWANNKPNNKIGQFKYIIIGITKEFLNFLIIPLIILKIQKLNIEIIHSNTSVVNIGSYLGSIMKIKHVWHIREFGEEHLNLQFLYGTRITRKIMQKQSDSIICISNAIFHKYESLLGNTNKLIRIYDGVELRDKLKKRNKQNGIYTILISGRVELGKSQLELVKAIAKIKKETLLVIAGEYKSDSLYYKEIQRCILDNKMQNKVNFIGYCEEIQDVRASVDLEIICSRDEGFGRVTVEAMMAELPVIGARSGATPEIIVEGETGLLYEPRNVQELAEKIEYLIDNPNLAKTMGKYGRQRAQEEFTIEKHARKIEKLYDSILSKK